VSILHHVLVAALTCASAMWFLILKGTENKARRRGLKETTRRGLAGGKLSFKEPLFCHQVWV